MPHRLGPGWCAIALLLMGCGAPYAGPPQHANVRPQDFAVVPCGDALKLQACALAIAGGKRVLFGAPAGVGATLSPDDVGQLDAVMLFSLRANDIEGLDEVRNASWQAGRRTPLVVFGPDGTAAMGDALNLAFESADALRIVAEGMPPGGFDAAVLSASDVAGVNRWQRVFDTGDLVIDAHENRDVYIDYVLTYQIRIGISACREKPAETAEADLKWIGCSNGDLAWPLRQTQLLFQAP